ncbi:hypothetical protein AURDEDRAFT_112642 [Auricularia subglabra TFB-10046 SS5]|nr:hypothetical protein AURDEDRAFT_112642 [Auricularia subglabra TFB-10046 SS5]
MANAPAARGGSALLRFIMHCDSGATDLPQRIKEEGLAGFAALARTSRSLQAALEPELYRGVFLDNRTPIGCSESVLEKLDKRADLAAQVQRLDLGWVSRKKATVSSLAGQPIPRFGGDSLCGALCSMGNLVTLVISQANVDWDSLARRPPPLPQLRRLSMVGTSGAVPWIQTVLPRLTHLAFSGPEIGRASFWRAVAEAKIDALSGNATHGLQYLQSSISFAACILEYTLRGTSGKKLAHGCAVHIIEATEDKITERHLALIGRAGKFIRILGLDARAVRAVYTILPKNGSGFLLPHLQHLLLGLPVKRAGIILGDGVGIKEVRGLPRSLVLAMFRLYTRKLLLCCPGLETLTFENGELHDPDLPIQHIAYENICGKLVGIRCAGTDLCFVRPSSDSHWQSASVWPVSDMAYADLDPFAPPAWLRRGRKATSKPRSETPRIGGLELIAQLREAGVPQEETSQIAGMMMSMRSEMFSTRGDGR